MRRNPRREDVRTSGHRRVRPGDTTTKGDDSRGRDYRYPEWRTTPDVTQGSVYYVTAGLGTTDTYVGVDLYPRNVCIGSILLQYDLNSLGI